MKILLNTLLYFVKVIVGTFLAMFIVFVTLSVIASAIMLGMSQQEEVSIENSFLDLSFPLPIQEQAANKLDFTNLFKTPVNFYNLLESVKAAKTDYEIKGIKLNLDQWQLSANQIQELNEALADFKSSGKPVVAYATSISNTNFLGALQADCLAMPKSNSAMVSLTGYSRSIPYYKNLISNLGIEVNVVHIGDYKAYGENYSHDKMSPEFKSELVKVFDQLHNERSQQLIAKLKNPQFQTQLEAGDFAMLTSIEAKALGLVDMLGLSATIEKNFFDDAQAVNWESYYLATSKAQTDSSANTLAVITLEGPIMTDLPEQGLVTQKVITPSMVHEVCQDIIEDPTIQGVVIRINSPGGSALASEMIFQELQLLKAARPTYISMGSVAASGGYYISCASEKIFAEPQTITGSIGVVSVIPNFAKLANKIGISLEGVTKGKYSDLFAPTKPTQQADLDLMRHAMLNIYKEFSSRVSVARNIPLGKLHNDIAQGRIWTGNQAKKIGLVDEIGGLNTAISQMAAELQLKNWSVKTYPKSEPILEQLMNVEVGQSVKLPKLLQNTLDQLSLYQALSYQPLTMWVDVPTEK